MAKHSRIFVAGNHGAVGGVVVRQLQTARLANVILDSREETSLENKSAILKLSASTDNG